MNQEKPHLVNLTKEIVSALNSRNIPYALSGAIANVVWGIPRATQDIDILISVPQVQLPPLLKVFFSLGFEGDLEELIRKAQKEYFIRLEHHTLTLEIFLPAIPYHYQVIKRRVKYEIEDTPAWFVSLEDLIILKLLFHRTKDIADIKAIIATQAHRVDKDYIMKTLPSLLLPNDARLKEIKELIICYTR